MLKTSLKLIYRLIFDLKRGKQHYAALLGHFAGIKWVINPKPDNGYNPFIKANAK
jgi:hypothetical protein